MFSENYSNVHLQIIEQSHFKFGTLMQERSDPILLYTMVLPPIDHVEHVQYTDVVSMKHQRRSSLIPRN